MATQFSTAARNAAAGAFEAEFEVTYADGNFLHVAVGHNVASVFAGKGTSMLSLSETNIASMLNRADMTYTNLWQATGLSGDPIYQFGRGGGATIPRPQCYSVSTDGGANWTEYQEWVWDEPNGHSPYCQFAGNAAAGVSPSPSKPSGRSGFSSRMSATAAVPSLCISHSQPGRTASKSLNAELASPCAARRASLPLMPLNMSAPSVAPRTIPQTPREVKP
jgi:hypothetical protein